MTCSGRCTARQTKNVKATEIGPCRAVATCQARAAQQLWGRGSGFFGAQPPADTSTTTTTTTAAYAAHALCEKAPFGGLRSKHSVSLAGCPGSEAGLSRDVLQDRGRHLGTCVAAFFPIPSVSARTDPWLAWVAACCQGPSAANALLGTAWLVVIQHGDDHTKIHDEATSPIHPEPGNWISR